MTDQTFLFEALHQGSWVITPNNRLCQQLLSDYFEHSLCSVLKKPNCYAYEHFIEYSFQAQHELKSQAPMVLTAHQQRLLWQTVLQQEIDYSLSKEFLNKIAQAWDHCHAWQFNFNHTEFSYNEQTIKFHHWSRRYLEALSDLGAITKAQMVAFLLAEKYQFAPKMMIWVCFDEFTPEQKSLQQALAAQGTKHYFYDLPERTTKTVQYAGTDIADEYGQLTLWLTERLDKDQRIAVIVPHLQEARSQLERIVTKTIPENYINFSLGQSLAQYPLVATACSLLKLNQHLSLHEARLLLYSPFIKGGQSELFERTNLLENSNIFSQHEYDLNDFIRSIEPKTPRLAQTLKQLNTYPSQASVDIWLKVFKHRLHCLGFPGEYALNSESFQCYQRFLELFDEFRQMGCLTQQLSQIEALDLFKTLANHTQFQPEQQAQVRIHFLGLLEASGCTFDSQWLLSTSDNTFPESLKPSPFIPLPLQRSKQMPRAHLDKEQQLAEKRLKRLQNASSYLVCSYARLKGDTLNRPSPYICIFPHHQPKEMEPSSLVKLISFTEPDECFMPGEPYTKGGTALLAYQAQCPFRAFAAFRLHAQPTIDIADGLDLRERGQIIHKIMEKLWSDLKNQATLLQILPEELNERIDQAIQAVLDPLLKQYPKRFAPLIKEVEQLRLHTLIATSLEWEKKRPAFAVAALEKTFTLFLNHLNLTVRIDRIDQVSSGKWVIDYKSRLPPAMPWDQDRPQEPQLLLYALIDESIDTLIFSQLKTGQISYKGIGQESNPALGISGLKTNFTWPLQRQHWQEQLQQLADEFYQGYCRPNPNPTICQRCDFADLCRFAAV